MWTYIWRVRVCVFGPQVYIPLTLVCTTRMLATLVGSATSTTPRLYVAIRTPRGTGVGWNDLTSPVLQMRKYQTRQLHILVARVGLRVLDVLLLRARALPLAPSLFWGVTFNHVFFDQVKQKFPSWAFDQRACGACKNRQQQVMRARRAWRGL